MGGESTKSEQSRGTNSTACLAETGAAGTTIRRTSKKSSRDFSLLIKGASRCSRCSFWRPSFTLRQSLQGCSPSKVFSIACQSESVLENSTSIRVQATDCSVSQCPPIMTNKANKLAATPVALNKRDCT